IVVTPEQELETVARAYMDEELWDRNSRIVKAASTAPTVAGGGVAWYAGSQALTTGDPVMGIAAVGGASLFVAGIPRTIHMLGFEGSRAAVRLLETVPTEEDPGRRMVVLNEADYTFFEEVEKESGEAEAVVDALLEA
ncbi:MAG: hypothetical protein SVW77_03810, partial [Candidatus Nanohaloarchaea archaeon]|nr:hypothetical protein [Candidatus Nanohaloarchaea archaeon]